MKHNNGVPVPLYKYGILPNYILHYYYFCFWSIVAYVYCTDGGFWMFDLATFINILYAKLTLLVFYIY